MNRTMFADARHPLVGGTAGIAQTKKMPHNNGHFQPLAAPFRGKKNVTDI
ncbi:hypothetical protein [Paenibacillus sp. YIM B09110]